MALLLEVIVQTVADARAAAKGGADRLEIVRDIASGGLTPSRALVEEIAAAVKVPLRVMVRENAGFTADDVEIDTMQKALASLLRLPIDGVVVGFAAGCDPDIEKTSAVLNAAPALHATFHRAFDQLVDPLELRDAERRLHRAHLVFERHFTIEELPAAHPATGSSSIVKWRSNTR